MKRLKIADKLAAMLCAGALVILPVATGAVHAQSIPAKSKGTSENAAKKKQEAERQIAAGTKAYDSGKLESAVESLSAGLRTGGLPAKQMAKALYIRGLAYRKLGKPALAISDLTSAVWLKGGLSETERSDAMENRVAAYREAGLGDGVAVPKTRPGSSPQTAAASSPTPPAAASEKPENKSSGWQTATIGSVVAGSTQSASKPALGLASAGESEAPPSSPGPSIGKSISNFFGNMFGSPSSSPSASTASIPGDQPKAAVAEQKVASISPQSWGAATQVSPATTRASARATDVVPVAATPPAPPAATGRYKLQVAAVRSRPDAEAVAARLKKEHGFRLDSREPVIDEAVYGNMGTFYRVRIGPYADATEPKQLCSAIKSGGFDCMVVTK